ncbi:oligosaccharide flippase family protein [Enterococcus gilvus]|uniref:murein biosynthesis integral membrane protein MurJ n=1 Tax=Enterococcus gilvus TaxID=160453 RepID=UPI002915C325|nr:oligosaccharide flippase family protein [Enterococcus gilvus]MDU5509054.1 oligosaccharide flippase family protein [Enterococcus gilvus]
MKAIKSFSSILFFSILAQIFLMIKSIFLASWFGTSNIMDSFNVANLLTISLFTILSSAISTILIPEMIKLFDRNEDFYELNDGIVTYVFSLFFLSFFFVLIFLIFGKTIVSFFLTSIINKNIVSLTYQLSIVLLFGQIFKLLSTVIMSLLQAENHFTFPKFSAFVAALFPVFIFLMIGKVDIKIITLIIGFSFIIEALLNYIYIINHNRLRMRIVFKSKNKYFQSMFSNTIPIIISSAVYQLSILINNLVISFFGEGYVSTLNYSNQILSIVQALLITNIMQFFYPSIAKSFKVSFSDGIDIVTKISTVSNAILIPISIGFLGLGKELIALLFQRGNFYLQDTKNVFFMSIILFMGIPINTLRDFIYRIFYSKSITRIPAKNSVFVIVLTIILSISFLPFFGEYSAVLSPVVASFISLINIYNKLLKEFPFRYNFREFLLRQSKIVLSSLLMLTVLLMSKSKIYNLFNSNLLSFAFVLLIAVIAYFILLMIFDKRILKDLKGIARLF